MPRTTGIIIARWTNSMVSLQVAVTTKGVRSIALDEEFVPGQGYFWPGIEPEQLNLAETGPIGRQLAQELDHALSGKPFARQVPWDLPGPSWRLALYRYVCRLPPGQATPLPGSLQVEGEYHDQRALRDALHRCALVPLVPVHRFCSAVGHRVCFPWGRKWGERLIAAERINQTMSI